MCRPVSEGGLGFDYRLALGVSLQRLSQPSRISLMSKHPDMWFKLLGENHDMALIPATSLTAILSSLMGRRAHLAEKTIAYVECREFVESHARS